jgi:stage II sporulation protein D
MLLDGKHRLLARVASSDAWRIERSGVKIRATHGTLRTGWVDGPIYAVSTSSDYVSFGGRRYRGNVVFESRPDGILVLNLVRIDDYLAGVVPLEIGKRPASDSAAVEAQAVAARSYAYVHLDPDGTRGYDVTATVSDQVYGGVDAELPVATRAITNTRGLVVKYAGRVVDAPYSSTCGGETAGASEVWGTGDAPYLRPVSDRIPGTDRFYCDIAPRFRWTRTYDAAELTSTVARYLATVVNVPSGGPGVPRAVVVASRTASGRVGALTITTDRGEYTVHGNDIRSVLRGPGGEILNSTYFSVDSISERDGQLTGLRLRGSGYGHGVGMCQWGAIGRARAGQDFRTILETYYPGTTVGRLE